MLILTTIKLYPCALLIVIAKYGRTGNWSLLNGMDSL